MNPLSGITVTASTEGKRVMVSPINVITDTNGEAIFKFRFSLVTKEGRIIFTTDGLTATIPQKD